MAETDRVRLHITPFNATLYQNIIPTSIQPNATNLSYHTVQTFPERGFGFVELPRADADKLRKKLNGATLRGQKMSVQEAKPEKRRRRDKDEEEAGEVEEKQPRKKAKKEKSSKKKDKEITGYELPDERQVKRGWTEEPGKYNKEKKEKSSKSSSDKADKKDKTPKREKSKYSSKQEVLFKQKLPEGVMKAQKAEGKEKKSKNTKQPKNIAIIHEFEKNTPVPSFLKSEVSGKGTATADFVEGKGWVDAEGNVVEEVHVKPKREDRIAKMKDTPVEIKIKPTAPKEPAMHKDITAGAKSLGYNSSEQSSVVSSESDEEMSDDSDDDNEKEEELEAEKEEIAEEIKEGAEEVAALADHEEPTSTPSPKDDSSDSDSSDEEPAQDRASTPTKNSPTPQPDTMDMSPKPTTQPREVHPLEALFKKKPSTDTTPRPAPINTSFSFGITSEDVDEEMADDFDPTYPSTPYTRTRDIRSAAPTPDTAAIGRKFSFSFANKFADEDVEEEGYGDEGYAEEEWNANMEPLGVKEKAEGEEETEFSKWFWENRGDSNRAWKKRRRDVMKLKRQRENRRSAIASSTVYNQLAYFILFGIDVWDICCQSAW
ncbi:hypothetical protein E4T47_04094 [Aureobasidium subglaciale]|nr:hypothetical protein E4T47_04094 [Aureobasidium subglaciale]